MTRFEEKTDILDIDSQYSSSFSVLEDLDLFLEPMLQMVTAGKGIRLKVSRDVLLRYG